MLLSKVNAQVEIIDYTTDMVYYHEDLEDAIYELDELKEKFAELDEEHEIGVSHFKLYGCDYEFNEDVIHFLENFDGEENDLEFMVQYAHANDIELDYIEDYLDNNVSLYKVGNGNTLHAFMEYCDEEVLYDLDSNLKYYFDYKKYMNDCELEGMEIYGNDNVTIFVF